MSTQQNHSQNQDYHGHPNYFMVWLTLVIIFIISLAVNELGNRQLAISLIFSLAIVKAILVLGNFMHLRWEPKMVWTIVGFAIFCLLALYYGVMPDLLWVPLKVAH